MADITITVDNTNEVLDRLHHAIAVAMEEIGMEGESNAVIEVDRAVYDTPMRGGYIRTSRLRTSLTHASDDNTAYIGTNVYYAPYVEMGTSKMGARPFLRPAAEDYMDDYREILVDHLMNA